MKNHPISVFRNRMVFSMKMILEILFFLIYNFYD